MMPARQSTPRSGGRKHRRAGRQSLAPHPGPSPHAVARPARYLTREMLCVAAAGLIIVALFRGGGQPVAAALIVEPWDKLAHFSVYGVITALLWMGAGGRAPCVIIALVIAIGALDELHQINVPGRTADAVDFLVDAAGAFVAGAVMLWLAAGNGRVRRMLRAAQPTGG